MMVTSRGDHGSPCRGEPSSRGPSAQRRYLNWVIPHARVHDATNSYKFFCLQVLLSAVVASARPYPPADLVGETVVLFRVRIDEATFTINEARATKLRNNRNIGDFRNWKDHDPYQKALARLLRDMRIEPA